MGAGERQPLGRFSPILFKIREQDQEKGETRNGKSVQKRSSQERGYRCLSRRSGSACGNGVGKAGERGEKELPSAKAGRGAAVQRSRFLRQSALPRRRGSAFSRDHRRAHQTRAR